MQNDVWNYLNTLWARCYWNLKQIQSLSVGYLMIFFLSFWDISYASMPIYSSNCFSIFVNHTGLWLHLGSKQNVSTVKVTGWWFLSSSVLFLCVFQLDDFCTFSICDLKNEEKKWKTLKSLWVKNKEVHILTFSCLIMGWGYFHATSVH